jgi:predicted enzyme related to lactoylglutathione lyase
MSDTPQAGVLPIAPSVKGVLTFFYYENLRAAVEFYQRIVGLSIVEDFGWCCILELQPRCYIGLIDAVSGSQRPIPGPNKGVVISIETANLDACLAQAIRLGATPASTAIEAGCRGRTREFRITDPGGYTVEFFAWVTVTPQ